MELYKLHIIMQGQELRIYRLNPVTVVIQEQDPTIDSSSQSFDNNIEMQGRRYHLYLIS